jgi:hypothetical protein
MSYRNITVDGTHYQYVIGKTHFKVRGFEAVRLEDVFCMKELPATFDKYDDGYKQPDTYMGFKITPKEVAEVIQNMVMAR